MNFKRTIAIGDIHGCSKALNVLLSELDIGKSDLVVTLGDYVGKGDDSCGVIESLIELSEKCTLISLLGNHELLMLGALRGEMSLKSWKMFGGTIVLDSYGKNHAIENIPKRHVQFLNDCGFYYETDSHIFAHACYEPDKDLADTDQTTLTLCGIREQVPDPHFSGRRAVVGHTCQKDGNVLDVGHLVCIDTGCWQGGWLTAFELESGNMIQVNNQGKFRDQQG